LSEHASDWFEIDAASPHMLMVADVVKGRRRAMSAEEQARFGIDKLNAIRSEIPAVTHVECASAISSAAR
jgi:carbamoyltransferase